MCKKVLLQCNQRRYCRSQILQFPVIIPMFTWVKLFDTWNQISVINSKNWMLCGSSQQEIGLVILELSDSFFLMVLLWIRPLFGAFLELNFMIKILKSAKSEFGTSNKSLLHFTATLYRIQETRAGKGLSFSRISCISGKMQWNDTAKFEMESAVFVQFK